MAFQTKWTQSGVIWKFSGTLTGDDIFRSSTEVYGDPRFDSMHFQLLDMIDVTDFDVSDDIIEEVSVMDLAASSTNPYLIIALIGSDKQIERLVSLYENTTGTAPWKTAIFETFEDARDWILSIFPNISL